MTQSAVGRRIGQRVGRASVRRAPLALAAFRATCLAALLLGCGGIKAPDLFIVQRSGSGPDAKLTLLVNEEGIVHCNGVGARAGHKLRLGDAALVQAREIQEDLEEPAADHLSLPPAAKSVLSYSVRDEHGSVRFSDNSADQPKVFHQLALFVLQTAQQVCGLPE
jgi:hypothetical protein